MHILKECRIPMNERNYELNGLPGLRTFVLKLRNKWFATGNVCFCWKTNCCLHPLLLGTHTVGLGTSQHISFCLIILNNISTKSHVRYRC